MAINKIERTISARKRRLLLSASVMAALAIGLLTTGTIVNAAGPTTVPLGAANSYAILAYSTITNTGVTTMSGNVGLYPGSSVTGFAPCPASDCVALTGTLNVANSPALNAKNALDAAYIDAAGRPVSATIPTELGPSTPNPLLPGVYNSASTTFGITNTLTLDAGNDPNGVFIFIMSSTAASLTTAVGSHVVLQGLAQACNVFWVVAGSATLGTDSTFAGTIMAYASISLSSGVTVDGRLLARTGAVTLIHDTITRSTCAAPVATPTPTPTPGATPTPTPTPTPGPGATPTPTPTSGANATPTPRLTPTPVAVVTPPNTSTVGAGPSGGSTNLLAFGLLFLVALSLSKLYFDRRAVREGRRR